MKTNFYSLNAKSIKGEEVSMEEYRGKTVLVVNTASKCGFAPQYAELQQLYEEYRDRGFVVLGFPCDQFAHQEPAGDGEIAQFCSINFGVNFPLFSKILVNGPEAHPLFAYLTRSLPGLMGRKVKWNFTKFLIGPDGKAVKRFAPAFSPLKIKPQIEKLLARQAAKDKRAVEV